MRLLLAAVLSLAVPAAAGAPDWVTAGSLIDAKKVVGVGAANSVEAAVAAALGEVAKIMKAKEDAGKGGVEEQRASAVMRTEAKRSFGPLAVSVTQTDSFDKDTDEQKVSSVTELRLRKGKQTYSFRYQLSSTTSGDMTRSREAQEHKGEYDGLALVDVLKELEAQGFTLKEWRDPKDYTAFVALERPVR